MSAHVTLPGLGDYYGLLGLWVENFGTLTTDIYGLSTATAVYVSPAHAMRYPSMRSSHPIWGFMHVEKRTVSLTDYGFCRAVCEYAGFEGSPVPVIEWSSGVSSEPIETHPNFATFAGTPSAPQNDAVWVDIETGDKTTDDTRGKFSHFAGTGPFAGVTSYLNPYLTKKETRIESQAIAVLSGVGHIDGTLLKIGASSTQRGIAFQNTQEWRSGGRRPINSAIYG
jgi:hypothetical protein